MKNLKSVNTIIVDFPYLFAVLVVGISGLISFVLDLWFLPTQGVLLILQLSVLITALSGNKKIAIFAGVLSGLVFNYFFTLPRFSLHMSDVDDIVNLLIFLIVAIITSYLAAFYKEQREALEKAELRASILMSVSHDLRTPLSTIIGTLSTLQEYQERLPKLEKDELLQGALEESHRLHRYIENLLQATKLQHGIKLNCVKQSLSILIKSVVDRFNTKRIQVVQADESAEVFASSYLLEQAIFNVIDNALKYSPSHSTVNVICSFDAAWLTIDVIDEGPGISPEDENLIFDLFFSTRKGDSGYGGAGIGLSVTKGIVEAHMLLTIILFLGERYKLLEGLSFATFHVISFITSTGYGAADLSSWPAQTGFFLVFCAYLGGCAGSTAGGNKIIRDIITFKVIRRELLQIIQPRAVLPFRFQGIAVDERVRHAVMAFMSIAAGSSLVFTLLLMLTGLDFWSAFTAVAACINVLGPGFGEVGSNFIPVTDTGIWLLNAAMILGRLEYFTVLAMLTPGFWRY